MNYSEDFKELIKKSAALIEKSKAYSFIGAGNPNGKILFIGKECAIDENMGDLYKAEIKEHINRWRENISEDLSQEKVDGECEELIKQLNYSKYNPLFPYKGKKKTIFDRTKRVDGVTRTWFFYQKLYDMICEKMTLTEEKIDFFEGCFMTELSHVTAKSSKVVDADPELRKERRKSIANRTILFTEESFFQSFPIVIFAAGPYVDDKRVNIPKIFNVSPIYESKSPLKGVYISNDTETPKLVIHTNQFSYTSNEQIAKIAELCREFIKDNNIELKNQQIR